MSYLSESRKGFELAEATQAQYFAAAMDSYERALKEIDGKLKDAYARLSGVDPANYWAELTKYKRYETLKEEITKAFKDASAKAGKDIKAGLLSGMEENYNRQLFLTAWLNAEIRALPINPYLLEFSVTGNIDIWNKIGKAARDKMSLSNYVPQAGSLTETLSGAYRRSIDRILQSIQNGFITGKSYATQANMLKDIMDNASYQALRIAQTEGTRVLNAAALNSAQAADAMLGGGIEKQWLATLDAKTRTDHRGLDGKRVPVDSEFRYGDAAGQAPGQMGSASQNIGCRCSMITIIDGIGPEIRRSRNPVTGKSEVISFKKYDEWINTA